MPHRKDFFISYGRKESKAFAHKLYLCLENAGYSGWFDMVNIPTGNDYVKQIEFGIQSAHNILFILSPHANRSEHCLQELELAIANGKRIIPVLHVTDEDAAIHPTLRRINWINARQQPSEKPLEEWEDIDNFDQACEELIALFEKEKPYITQHTHLLLKALQWETAHYPTDLLLEGEERLAAQSWLLRSFPPPEQQPAKPIAVIAEYLCESRKNAENLLTDVFVNFQSDSLSIHEKLRAFLNSRLITSWDFQRDLKKGAKAMVAQQLAIEQTANFLFPITEKSVQDEGALERLQYAVSLNKRIIPLLAEQVAAANMPDELKGLHPIDFTDNHDENDLISDLSELIKEIDSHDTYFKNHRNLLVQALKWSRNQKKNSILLRGNQIRNAQDFLKIGNNQSLSPLPLHREFIEKSEAAQLDFSPEVFIAYSRKDGDFARRLNNALQINGKVTWFDQESIFAGAEDFEKEMMEGIEDSDNFLFVITPHALESGYCQKEIERATTKGKRIITIMLEEPLTPLPDSLKKINWIDFKNQEFDLAFTELLRAINTDRSHIRQHNRLQQKANEWLKEKKESDRLLRGSELAIASAWLQEAEYEQKQPSPTALHKDFIEKSNDEQELEQRKKARTIQRLRLSLVVSIAGLLAAIIFGYWAFSLKNKAEEARDQAERLKTYADSLREQAEASEESAKEIQRALNVLNSKYAVLLELAEDNDLLAQKPAETEMLVQEIQMMQQQIDEVNLESSSTTEPVEAEVISKNEDQQSEGVKTEQVPPAATQNIKMPPKNNGETEKGLAPAEPVEAPSARQQGKSREMTRQEAARQEVATKAQRLKRRSEVLKALPRESDSLFVIAVKGLVLDAQGKELKRGQKIGNEKGLRFMTEDARLSVVNKNGTYILNKSGKRSVERD